MSESMRPFRTRTDYEIPLLQVLSELPGGFGSARMVRDYFDERFGQLIPEEHRVYMENYPDYKWRNILAWTRNELKNRGLMDMPRIGIWRITQEGRVFLAQALERELPDVGVPPAQEPAGKLERASERRGHRGSGAQPSADSYSRAHAVLDRFMGALGSFFNGQGGRPSDERLCDWVHLCYEFELYREGRDLFALVDPAQVIPWYYERARRLARVCSMKAAGHA